MGVDGGAGGRGDLARLVVIVDEYSELCECECY